MQRRRSAAATRRRKAIGACSNVDRKAAPWTRGPATSPRIEGWGLVVAGTIGARPGEPTDFPDLDHRPRRPDWEHWLNVHAPSEHSAEQGTVPTPVHPAARRRYHGLRRRDDRCLGRLLPGSSGTPRQPGPDRQGSEAAPRQLQHAHAVPVPLRQEIPRPEGQRRRTQVPLGFDPLSLVRGAGTSKVDRPPRRRLISRRECETWFTWSPTPSR